MKAERRGIMETTAIVLIVFSISFAKLSSSQTICPTGNTCTYSSINGQYVYGMDCKNLGTLRQLPPSCTDTAHIISDLTIDSNGTSVANIQANAFNGLKIVKLVLQQLQIKSLDSKAFVGLGSYLQVLYLNDNLLSQLPIGVFSTLTTLTTLQLHANRLTSLWSMESPNGVAVPLPTTGNGNETTSILTGLVGLQHITLQGNLIENISNEIFYGLSALQDLSMEGNRIQTLDSDVFSNLTSLMNLNMTSNVVDFLPENLFKSNPEMLTIDFSNNEITAISHTTFYGLFQLQVLYLNDNNITVLHDYIFKDFNNILHLRLQNNQIGLLESNSLSGLPILLELYLQNNFVQEIPIGLFDSVGSVTTMNLSSNLISVVEKKPFSSQSNLLHLDMSNNKIPKITADWFLTTRNIETLLLNDNEISFINSTSFNNMPTVTEINLSRNQLNEANVRGIFAQNTNLEILRLDENPLTMVSQDTFSGLVSLTSLYLNGSCIKNISFDVLPYLQNLYLQYNFIESIPASALTGLTALQTLDLAVNNISDVEDRAFSAASSLLLLNLTQNSLNSSQVAKLSSAPLSQATVDLSWNQMTTLDTFPAFKQVYLAGNPFPCNCSDLQGLSSLSTFADYDMTLCTKAPGGQTFAKLVCYISNQTVCNHTTLVTRAGLCSAAVPNYNNISAKHQATRNLVLQRCVSPTPSNTSMFMYLDAVPISETALNVTWKVNANDTSDVDGYKISWTEISSGNSTGKNSGNWSIVNNVNQTEYIINHLDQTENYTICVQVMLAENTTTGDVKCVDVSFVGNNGCVGNADKCPLATKDNGGVVPLILYIIIPIAIILLIIIIIIIIVIVIRKKKNAKDEEKNAQMRQNSRHSVPDTISKASNSGMAGQSDVTVDMLDY